MITKKIVFFLLLIGFQLSAQSKKWTLEECVDYAIKNNISVKQSELDLKNATINKKDAVGAFLPSVNGSASHSWNIGLNQNITTGLLENQTTQFTSAGLNVGIDIYNGLRNQLQLRKSNLQIIATQYQLTKMQEDIALNVANAYLQILFNKENLKVQLQQKEGKMIIALDVLGSINGTIYLSGIPNYNPITKEIYFDQMEYVLNTKSVLMKSANWLLHGTILKSIQENCRYSIKGNLEEGKQNMKPYLSNYSPMKGVFVNGIINDFEFEKVELTDKAIIAFITTSGKMDIKVDGLE